MNLQNSKYLPAGIFVSLSLIWSSTWLAIKVGLESLPPFLSLGIRFFAAFLFLAVYIRLRKIKFPSSVREHLFFLLFGIINFTGGYAFVYWGEQYIPSGLTSVLFSIMPFYVLIISWRLFPEDKINWQKLLGVCLGFAGLIVIFSDQLDIKAIDQKVFYGMLAVLIAPLFSAIGSIMGKKATRRMNPFVLNTMPLFYASVFFFILSWVVEQKANPIFDSRAILSLLYLALFGTSVAFVMYFWMMKNTSVIMMSMITYVTPPLALIWGWLFLDEQISSLLVLGLLFIFGGIYIVRKW
jgi:drug/metabolite transporter (DMT)-like permease